MEIAIEVLRELQKRDATFLERFASRKHGRKRQLVARERERLYPGRPDLSEDHARELVPGWWIGTNYSQSSMKKLLRLACVVAGVGYDSELVIEW